MKFAEPIWLFVGLAVLAGLFLLYRRFDARQRQALAEFASSHLLAKLTASFSPGRRRIKRGLFALALALVFIALARPQLGYHWEEQKQRGIDLLFAVDTSKSMLTQDVSPDRLTRAKLAITDFVHKLDGDRVGLIAFAGDAFLQAPLTLDYNAFGESLDALDTNVVPRGGTDISSAIQEAQAAFGKSSNRKILVLITDGEDLELKGIDSARAAGKDGLTIYTIGVGSAAGGLIPVPGSNGGTDFVKDDSGQYVKSHLDESTLKQIAEATGGLYQPLGQQGQGLQAIYDQALASLPKQDLASRTEKVYDERFQWPLTAGLVCLIASMLIGTRRRNVPGVPRAQQTARVAAVLTMISVLALVSNAHASVQSAEQAYHQGDYSSAEKQYEQATKQRPDAAPLQFNLGASAYKSGQYDSALPAFQKALNTDQVGVQQQAYYDMGNTQYRMGQKAEKSAPEDAIKTWKNAVQSYEAALKLKPDDADAKFNHDFVQKKLEQLQKQQQQQKKDDQKQDQKQDQKHDQNQKQDQQNQKQDSSQNQKQDQQNQQQQSDSQGNQQDQQDKQANNQKPSQGNQQDQKQSGSQQDQAQDGKADHQNQNGQQGQPKDQNGQQETAGNQQPKRGNDQGQQQQPRQQQGNDGDQNAQTAQNGMKPAGPRGATVPDKDAGKQQPAGNVVQTTDKPGEMSAEEAQELLNSMKTGEHVLAATADNRNAANHSQDQQILKDW